MGRSLVSTLDMTPMRYYSRTFWTYYLYEPSRGLLV